MEHAKYSRETHSYMEHGTINLSKDMHNCNIECMRPAANQTRSTRLTCNTSTDTYHKWAKLTTYSLITLKFELEQIEVK